MVYSNQIASSHTPNSNSKPALGFSKGSAALSGLALTTSPASDCCLPPFPSSSYTTSFLPLKSRSSCLLRYICICCLFPPGTFFSRMLSSPHPSSSAQRSLPHPTYNSTSALSPHRSPLTMSKNLIFHVFYAPHPTVMWIPWRPSCLPFPFQSQTQRSASCGSLTSRCWRNEQTDGHVPAAGLYSLNRDIPPIIGFTGDSVGSVCNKEQQTVLEPKQLCILWKENSSKAPAMDIPMVSQHHLMGQHTPTPVLSKLVLFMNDHDVPPLPEVMTEVGDI